MPTVSNFNPDLFLSAGQAPTANVTRITPVPPGEYRAVIEALKAEQFTGSKEENKDKVYTKMTAILSIQDEALKANLKREKIVVRHDVLLEMLPDGSGIDMGKDKNAALGRLRAACGMNQDGQPWSFGQMIGRPVVVQVTHREYNGETYAEASRVAAPQ